ncbi:tyrosine-type recombinase/integrase [Staphylococcus nepalensis]|uniref:Integrase n=1 Tax=Staphylococcus nepalensis TaxID=214473 RepID=A0A380GQ37_9STAP|nr:tyrosine-type recombinase/integrase [Staphylococcus nepalensis]PNZ92911.1 site-specific integrase [Staphylococcus nepalensis]GGB91427.1 site-specific integrase [Staphylococcus nepalensis]SUM55800.1 integrase [Staphylococcus nepalensis]VDG67776.1 integrase-like protein [Lacrimispora indolis]
MAYIEKRGKTWRYSISYVDDEGNRKKVQKGGYRTKQEAKRIAEDLEYKMRNGYAVSNDITFADYFYQWYEVNKLPHVSESTKRHYESAYKHIKEHFRHKLLKDIKRTEYQKFLNEYGLTHSYETIRKLNSYIRNAFDDAIHEGYVIKNPTYKAELHASIPAKTEEMKFINESEFKKLKHYFEQKNTTSSLVLLVALATGGRFSEIAKLKREDLDIKNNKIHLRGTKTETSDRVISIDAVTMKRIQSFIDSRPTNISGYIFTVDGKTITNAAVNKVLRKACDNLNIKEITIHSLRHSFCSILIHHGFSILYISKHLGHSNPATTQSIYSHLLQETYEREDEKAMKLLETI